MSHPGFDSWAIVELLGHVKMAGRLTEEERFGTKMARIDIPKGDPAGVGFVTQYFTGSSVYRITPTTEEVARAAAVNNQPAPVHRWELPAPKESPPSLSEHEIDEALAEMDDCGEEHA